VSGRLRDPRLHTTALPVVQLDFRSEVQSEVQSGLGLEKTEASKAPLLRVNPLANWTRDQVFCYIEERRVPVNELHAKGFRTIGCEPCTRPAFAGQPAGYDIWWWEKPDAERAVEPAGSGI
jgi:phosphoadenosine phosphosulfate reductase